MMAYCGHCYLVHRVPRPLKVVFLLHPWHEDRPILLELIPYPERIDRYSIEFDISLSFQIHGQQ